MKWIEAGEGEAGTASGLLKSRGVVGLGLHTLRSRVPASAEFKSIVNKLVLILLAIFLPPVAVVLKRGFGKDLLINILLCLLVFFPGMVHALWVVSK